MEQNTGTMDTRFSQEKIDFQEQQLLNPPSSMASPDSTVRDDYTYTEMHCVAPQEYGLRKSEENNKLPESVKSVSPPGEANSIGYDGVDSTMDVDDCTSSDIDFNFNIAINYIMSEMESSDAVSNLCLKDYENSTIRKVLISTLISPDYLPVYTQFYGKNMFFILEFGYRVAETAMKLPVLNLADLIRAEFDIAFFTDEAKQGFLAFSEAEYAFLAGVNSATTPDETRMLLLRFLIDADASCVEEKCSTTEDLPQLIEFVVMINCLIHKTMVCTTQIRTYQLENLLTAARIVYENLRVFVDFLASCCSVVRHKMTKMHYI
ncbi:hypothetical protein R5R35_000945 [Gryllus longicercus]|uniref:Uncharacterized protein n=1 Tax=Gryllus longicercus TaxID=2509291 RepID=A0AAN9VFN5_9ORTH